MIRKTIRIGRVRTSTKLEPEFWAYLKEVANNRSIRLSRLVNEVAMASPERTNFASTLRTFCLTHAQLRLEGYEEELKKFKLAGNTLDLMQVLDAYFLPCLLLDHERTVQHFNPAFTCWLKLDGRGILGQRFENLLTSPGLCLATHWQRMFGGIAPIRFSATYVSPGHVCTAQAMAIGLSGINGDDDGAWVVMFETLAEREPLPAAARKLSLATTG